MVGTLILLCGLLTRSGAAAVVGVVCMVGTLAAQGRGHKMEPETPLPFDGPADFFSRFFVEQWVTFPALRPVGRVVPEPYCRRAPTTMSRRFEMGRYVRPS